MLHTSAGPVTARERIAELDGLRGFALLGVALANLATFTGWFGMSPEVRAALPTAAVDGVVWFLTHVFVEGKFYTLFSLLFGIGFAVQMSRAGARAEAPGTFERRFRRRLFVLLGIGLVHLCLIWFGDILTLYALCGFALLLFRTRSDRTLLVWAVALLVLPIVQDAVTLALFDPADPESMTVLFANPGIALFLAGDAARESLGLDGWTAFETGGIRDVLLTNLTGVLYRFGSLLYTGRFFKVFGIFLLGLWCGRRLTAGTLLSDTRLLRRVAAWGLIVGLPANGALAWVMANSGGGMPSASGMAETIAYALGVVPLALAYAAGFVLLWRRAAVRRLISVAAPVGRMALTNYLAQSLMGIGLFYGIGLGLRVGPTGWTLIGLVVFAGQIAASAWWLRRFRYGPAEWLWRRLTYAEALPMRASTLPVPA